MAKKNSENPAPDQPRHLCRFRICSALFGLPPVTSRRFGPRMLRLVKARATVANPISGNLQPVLSQRVRGSARFEFCIVFLLSFIKLGNHKLTNSQPAFELFRNARNSKTLIPHSSIISRTRRTYIS
jgi:hypothetical protein